MKLAELASTGAVEISVFHALSAGKGTNPLRLVSWPTAMPAQVPLCAVNGRQTIASRTTANQSRMDRTRAPLNNFSAYATGFMRRIPDYRASGSDQNQAFANADGHRLGTGGGVELVQDGCHVKLRRVLGDVKLKGNGLVGGAFGHHAQDLDLARRQDRGFGGNRRCGSTGEQPLEIARIDYP